MQYSRNLGNQESGGFLDFISPKDTFSNESDWMIEAGCWTDSSLRIQNCGFISHSNYRHKKIESN